MELSTIQLSQSETNDEIPSAPPAESAEVHTVAYPRELEEREKFEATVAPVLKANFGFSIYALYVENIDLRYRDGLKKSMGLKYDGEYSKARCAIIDLSTEKHLPTRVSLRCAALRPNQTFTALREPPRGVSVEVVVLSLPDEYDLDLWSGFASVLGLGLKLAPRFFEAARAQLQRYGKSEVSSNASFRCKYLLASGTVVAIARHFALAKPDSPSVVLIVGPPRIQAFINKRTLYDNLYDGRPFPAWVHEDISSGGYSIDSDDLDSEGARHSGQLLSALMQQNQECIQSCNDVLIGSLLPLLQLDVLRIRDVCLRIRVYFAKVKSPVSVTKNFEIIEDLAPSPEADEAPDNLYRWRTELRSTIEQFESEAEPLAEFVCSQIGEEVTKSSVYLRIQRSRDSVLKEAHRLEAEIRDYLQVQAGQLALLESRKSISCPIIRFRKANEVSLDS